jgi:hypothetical protein
MKRILISLCLLFLFCINACKKEKTSENNNSNASKSNSYSGEVQFTQDSSVYNAKLIVSFASYNPTQGSFFNENDGTVGTIISTSQWGNIQFTGQTGGYCPATYSGNLIPVDNNNLSIQINGQDCGGTYSAQGNLTKVSCIDLNETTYKGTESGEVTMTYQGQTQTQTFNNSANVVFQQSGCSVSYSVPGTQGVARTGNIQGDSLFLSGDFVIGNPSNTVFTKNLFTAKAAILDNYHFSFNGTGYASGTSAGEPFTITGQTNGVFKRCFKVAAAVLKGNIQGDITSNSPETYLVNQILAVDPKNVISTGIKSGNQNQFVLDWYNTFSNNCDCSPVLVLVGYSAGGDAIVNSDIPNVFSKFTIDPVSPSLCLLNQWDQRGYSFPPHLLQGYFTNIQSENPGPVKNIRGYNIQYSNLLQLIEIGTNHWTVVERVIQKPQYMTNEIQRALNAYPCSKFEKSAKLNNNVPNLNNSIFISFALP